MKTANDWFKLKLEKEELKLALDNTSNANLEVKYLTFRSALFNSFQWDNTKQGFEYWHKIWTKNG